MTLLSASTDLVDNYIIWLKIFRQQLEFADYK